MARLFLIFRRTTSKKIVDNRFYMCYTSLASEGETSTLLDTKK